MEFDPRQATVLELLATYGTVMRELRDRGVVRTANSPVGDYAEFLVAATLGLELNANSSSGCDAVGPDGTRYEIKSRRRTPGSNVSRFSAIRNLEAEHFDVLVAVLLNDDFSVDRAVCLAREAVERLSFWQEHVNAWILPTNAPVWNDPAARDITQQVREAQRTVGLGALPLEGASDGVPVGEYSESQLSDREGIQPMPSRNYFTPDEITLCAYAAMHDANDFGGVDRIQRLTDRSPASIKMKIQNIAAMLDESGVERHSDIAALSGRPPGESGRMTNWDYVEPLSQLEQP